MPRDYDKPKRSWREIDQGKDRSAHRKEDRPKMNQSKQARANSASQVYKARLDSFFDGEGQVPDHLKDKFAKLEDSKEGQERKAAAAAIVDAKSSRDKTKAVERYLERWELPPDYGVLCEVLACSEEELQDIALDEIGRMFDANRVPRRKSILEQRLKSLLSLAEDEDLEEKAKGLLKKLRLFK